MVVRAFFVGLLFVPTLVIPNIGFAHHNVANRYDSDILVEVEGVITQTIWRNPHVQISMRVTDENGDEEIWEMATQALSNLRRWQIEPDFIAVGETVRIAGNPARGGAGMYITNVLTTGGEEVLLDPNAKPRWSDRTIEMATSRRAKVGDATAPELGIFRVWSHPEGVGMLFPEDVDPNYSLENYPLTDAARAVIANFVRERDNPIANCQPKGMPTIMEAPYPHEFTQDGDDILWHQEEYDTIRNIHMASDATAEGKPTSRLGYSIGHWENDNTLVVTTTKSNWLHFDTAGIPLSEDAEMVERFTLSPDGSRLDFTITVTDAQNFTEPATAQKYWLYFEGAEVGSYECFTGAEN